ncbi:MAG: carboxypeptidase-like regulatory domain-containing protein [Bryobacteraceae bacterium]
MVPFLLFVALSSGIAFGQAPPTTGALTGKVVEATTKEGIRKATVYATVQIAPPAQGAALSFAPPPMYSAVTDNAGNFRFPALQPGTIDLRAEKAGYLPRATGQPARAVVMAGQEATAAELTMVRHAIIAGRVTDSDGEPVEQATVVAIPARRTRPAGIGGGGQAMTDDRGEFRIPRLAASTYRLLATKPQNTFATPNMPAAEEPMMVSAPTYFPSALDQASASSITVGSGDERTGVEIRLQRTAAVRVSGRVTGETGNTPAISVTLQTAGTVGAGMPRGFGFAMNNWHAMAGADGRFVFPNVIPGEYFAYANLHRSAGGGSSTLNGVTRVRVGQQDVEELVIQLQPLARIKGKATAEGDARLPYEQINIGLASAEIGLPGGGGGQVKQDGTFLIENVHRARMKVNSMAPRGWYLKAVWVGGEKKPGLELDLTGGDTEVELIYGNKPGTVEVSVEGLPVDGPLAFAAALPDGEGGAPSLTNLYKTVAVRAGQKMFKIEDVPPGNYQIVVCPPGAVEAFSDPAVWERLKSKAVAVKVEEGVTVSAAPRLIVESDVDEK